MEDDRRTKLRLEKQDFLLSYVTFQGLWNDPAPSTSRGVRGSQNVNHWSSQRLVVGAPCQQRMIFVFVLRSLK